MEADARKYAAEKRKEVMSELGKQEKESFKQAKDSFKEKVSFKELAKEEGSRPSPRKASKDPEKDRTKEKRRMDCWFMRL